MSRRTAGELRLGRRAQAPQAAHSRWREAGFQAHALHEALSQLFDEDMLGDDLEAWMDESTSCGRSFRNVAVIAG